MKTIDENRQYLVAELIARSVKIDELALKSRENPAESWMFEPVLDELRARQLETTHQLHASEEHSNHVWENIGCGG